MDPIELELSSDRLVITLDTDDPALKTILHALANTLERLYRIDDANRIRQLIVSLEKR